MIEKIRHDLNGMAQHYIIAQGAIDLYAETICDAVEEYLATLAPRVKYVTDYLYDPYEKIGYFTTAVYDTQRAGGDMWIFTYKYQGGTYVQM